MRAEKKITVFILHVRGGGGHFYKLTNHLTSLPSFRNTYILRVSRQLAVARIYRKSPAWPTLPDGGGCIELFWQTFSNARDGLFMIH